MLGVAMLLFVACTKGPTNDKTTSCGPAPLMPGTTVSFGSGVASLPEDQWEAFQTWADDMDDWSNCINAMYGVSSSD